MWWLEAAIPEQEEVRQLSEQEQQEKSERADKRLWYTIRATESREDPVKQFFKWQAYMQVLGNLHDYSDEWRNRIHSLVIQYLEKNWQEDEARELSESTDWNDLKLSNNWRYLELNGIEIPKQEGSAESDSLEAQTRYNLQQMEKSTAPFLEDHDNVMFCIQNWDQVKTDFIDHLEKHMIDSVYSEGELDVIDLKNSIYVETSLEANEDIILKVWAPIQAGESYQGRTSTIYKEIVISKPQDNSWDTLVSNDSSQSEYIESLSEEQRISNIVAQGAGYLQSNEWENDLKFLTDSWENLDWETQNLIVEKLLEPITRDLYNDKNKWDAKNIDIVDGMIVMERKVSWKYKKLVIYPESKSGTPLAKMHDVTNYVWNHDDDGKLSLPAREFLADNLEAANENYYLIKALRNQYPEIGWNMRKTSIENNPTWLKEHLSLVVRKTSGTEKERLF